MNLLILHPNYPAQFRHLCELLPQHDIQITFIAQNLSKAPLPSIKVLCLAGKCGKDYLDAAHALEFDRTLERGKQYLVAMQHLSVRGYKPDVVIVHSGWGCAQHLKDVWPNCKLVAYLEWIFNEDSDLSRFEPPGLEQVIPLGIEAKLQARNQLTLAECSQADLVVTPTHWQRSQIPYQLRYKCIVNQEGVDLGFYHPSRTDELGRQRITYGTRGMEPIRGFSYFVNELVRFLPLHPDVHAEIAGEDNCFYSPSRPPLGNRTWGQWARGQLQAAGVAGRVHFMGRLPASEYLDWLRHSSLHVYLTQPFVLSWSLLEALASAVPLVVTRSPTTTEFLSPASSFLIDHRIPGWLNSAWMSLRSTSPSGSVLRSRALRCSQQHSLNRWHSILRQLFTINS